MQKKKQEPTPTQNDLKHQRFAAVYGAMPRILQIRFVKQLLAAVLICILSITMIFYFHSWTYSIGFLLAIGIAAFAMDIVWSFEKGTILCKQMICVKSQQIVYKKTRSLLMKEMDENGKTHKFCVTGDKKEMQQISPNTVLNVCYKESNDTVLIAWEIIDYIGQ